MGRWRRHLSAGIQGGSDTSTLDHPAAVQPQAMPNSGRTRSDDPGCLARLARQGREHAALPSAHEADASTSRTERLAIKPSARCGQRQSGGMGQTAGVIATPEKASFFEATLNNPHADLLQKGPIGGRRRDRRSAFPAGDPRHVEPPTARVRRPLNRSGDAMQRGQDYHPT